jgi:hypothetical protein
MDINNIISCNTVKLYDILKLKNALVQFVYYVTECTICRLVKSRTQADNINVNLRKTPEGKRRTNQS